MSGIIKIGKWLYAIPLLFFGAMHFMAADQMAGVVPIPGGVIWVYITGAALIAAAVSIFIGKMDKLAATLLGFMLLIFALSIHLPNAMDGDQVSMSMLLKDTAMAGGAWLYAQLARDPSGI